MLFQPNWLQHGQDVMIVNVAHGQLAHDRLRIGRESVGPLLLVFWIFPGWGL